MTSPAESELVHVLTPDQCEPLDGLTDAQVDRILDTLYPVKEWPDDCGDDEC